MSEVYQSLYRKYRPRTFSDVVGQSHIKSTLKSAVIKQKVAHGYLFSGPRGTGKTSIAKIMAMALNCLHTDETIRPCMECESCKRIMAAMDTDIVEIDAASNNGVGEIREITDKVKYAPTFCKYKVYIIDEVHMLSTGAFNALLKTLEEPPAHVIFILATTEPHKIPATIISRCQRFDFKSIDGNDIRSRIEFILKKEDIEYENDALDYVIKSAEGGMRDALSILDQVIAYSENKITKAETLEVIGLLGEEQLAKLAKILATKQAEKALTFLTEIIESGKDIKQVSITLIGFYRDLLIVKSLGDEAKNYVSNLQVYKEIASLITKEQIHKIIEILNEANTAMRYSSAPMTIFEVSLIKICNDEKSENIKSVDNVSQSDSVQIQELKQQLSELKTEFMLYKRKMVKPIGQTVEPINQSVEKTYADVQKTEKSIAYSVSDVIKVLQSADKTLRTTIQGHWHKVMMDCKTIHPNLEVSLELVKMGAASEEVIVLTTDSRTIANGLNRPENSQKITQLLELYMSKKYNFIVVTNDIWQQAVQKFMSEKDTATKETKPKEVSSVGETLVDLFGEEKVNIN